MPKALGVRLCTGRMQVLTSTTAMWHTSHEGNAEDILPAEWQEMLPCLPEEAGAGAGACKMLLLDASAPAQTNQCKSGQLWQISKRCLEGDNPLSWAELKVGQPSTTRDEQQMYRSAAILMQV